MAERLQPQGRKALTLVLRSMRQHHQRLQAEIQELRATQAILEASQTSFMGMFRLSQAAMTLSTWPESRHIVVNEAWTELTGVSGTEAIGRSSEELGLLVDSEQGRQIRDELETDGRVHDRELLIRRRDGELRTIVWSARLFNLGGNCCRVSSAVDITGSKRATEALLDSERRLRVLFEGSPIGIFRSTAEGQFLQVNPALARIFRYPDPTTMVEEVNRRGIPEALYESPAQRSNLMQRLHDHQEEWLVEEVHFRRRDGTFMDGIMSIILNPDPATGRPLLFGFVQDISARKMAEDALRGKTALLEAQTNATLDGILVIAEGRKRSLLNRQMIDMFHIPAEILADEDDASMLNHAVGLIKTPERFLERVQYLYAHPDETSRDEIEFKDGTVLDRYSAPVLGEEGKNYGRIWTFRDITEHKRAEHEILQLKNYLSSVINSMPAMLAGIDREGRVTHWNRAAEALLGVATEAACGRPIDELAKEFAPWVTALRQESDRERRPASIEKLFLLRDGERHFFELMLYPLMSDGIEGAVVRIQDITERVRIEELMIQTEKMMSVGGLAAGMAHEINNPLGIISQAAQNIERRISPDLPANRAVAEELGLDLTRLRAYFERRQLLQFIGGIREAVDRASRIVSNMLQFSRHTDSARHPAALAELLEQALDLAANDYDLKKKCAFRDIEIQREYQEGLPCVPVVAIEVEQVLLNLLRNAAQAMATNPPEKPPRLVLRIRREDRHGVIEVEDNGPGMNEAVRRRVFEPFFTTKEPGVGTGLGLSVSYTIVTQNHKGLLEVVSLPGRGACFTVRLPLARETENG